MAGSDELSRMSEASGDETAVESAETASASEEDEAVDVPPDLLKGVPPEEQTILRRVFSSLTHYSGPAINPIFRQVKPEHITQILTNAEEDSKRRDNANSSGRRYAFGYFCISVIVILALIVLFAVLEQYEIVVAIISAVAGFSGGFGVGRYFQK